MTLLVLTWSEHGLDSNLVELRLDYILYAPYSPGNTHCLYSQVVKGMGFVHSPQSLPSAEQRTLIE